MTKKLVFIIAIVLLGMNGLLAQTMPELNVQDLSDQQIMRIIEEMNNRGLSIDEAAQMARIQGASAEQIEELKKRVLEMEKEKETEETEIVSPEPEEDLIKTPKKIVPEKKAVEPDEAEKKIFGFHFFNSEKLTFEPPANLPVPGNYVLGIDDEVMIVVWGANEKTYRLRVGMNGSLVVPELGPVFVTGMEFSKAKERIIQRLHSIYQGMGGHNPTTFADVSVSKLRSIRVNVVGETMMPGTYTLPATATAFHALYMSGGPNRNGTFRNIQIIRDNQIIHTIDVYQYLIDGSMAENPALREQDIIHIPVYEKRITVSGAFKRTGFFEVKGQETLSDLIRYAGGFGERAYQANLSVTRITEKEKKVLDISPSLFDSFLLQNGDSVMASAIIDRYENRVNISGAVFRPGTYELTEGLTLNGLIGKALGVKESYYPRGMIIRLQDNLAPLILSFHVDEVCNGIQDIPLKREDQVIIQDIFNMREKQTVQIFGEVQHPGIYDYADSLTLKGLIYMAGGFNEAASESFIELARRHDYSESIQINDELVKLFQFNIDRELNIDSTGESFVLKPFDYVYVRRAPSYYEQRTVYISGEVRYPGAYSIGSKKERISDLVKRAGGLMPNAFVKGATLQRVNKQIERNIDVLQSALEDSLLVKMESQISNTQQELRLESILKNPGTEFDYLLKDGDQIFIPEFSQEVRITGEIRNPMGLAYEDGRNLLYYVERNGGFNEKAKRNDVFVIYSDGTTKVTRNFIWPIYPEIEPGCQIVIPPKPERTRIDNTGKWLSVASTIASIMLVISTIANK
ncbi:MAG TPA: SLBB domain-containing protein [Prolixibacteraceae bacterium]|nr:SLBB domain-containing protein [Prolixibacteraceae bacterium]